MIPRVIRRGAISVAEIAPGDHVGPRVRREPMKRKGASEASIPSTATLVKVSK